MWKRVVAPTLLVCLLWMAVSGASTYYIHWLARSNNQILTENVASILAAGRMQEALWKMEAAFVDVVEDEHRPGLREFDDLEMQFREALEDAERAVTSAQERPMVDAIRERFAIFREVIHRGLKPGPLDEQASARLAGESMKLAHGISGRCTELLEWNERLMNDSMASRAKLESKFNAVRLIWLILGPCLGIYLGLRIARKLHRSISQISVRLKDASGELDHEVGRVEISRTANAGELWELDDQVQAVSARIREVLSELQKARQEAMLSERLAVVGELAAGVAHELRNPLTSVKLLMQAAPREKGGMQLREKQSQVVLHEISRMEETIQALLDFARPPPLNRVEHDLRATIRRAINLVEGRAAHDGIRIVSQLPDEPLCVDGDPEQLHQVFVNLLINGIESMSHGGTLEVSLGLLGTHPQVCQVIVADRGTGIPDDRLTRIFEPFVTTKEHGTGLGLPVSRRIVGEHGGAIFAANRREGGAVFTVQLATCHREATPRDAIARAS
ncbi:MAG TPA: ATP-binding protein [Planctomycetaceae bacterium]|nr:ATP-binding protein [Planctomycetaceae bacterium]